VLKGDVLFSKATWTVKDLLFVTAIIFVGPMVVLPPVSSLLHIVARGQIANVEIFIIVVSTFMILAPTLWIKARYGIGKTSLGIRKGRLGVISMILIGIGAGVMVFALESIMSGRSVLVSRLNVRDFSSSWFIIRVLGSSVLAPMGNEVYFRGFTYGYLRRILGWKLGLIAQALVFSLFHVDFILASSIGLFIKRLLAGMLLGLIYDVSGSIYPSVICHAVINLLYILG
jgi:membrane protease YdiL (CAAX protease family)